MSKKFNVDLDLRKKSCAEPFDVKNQSAGIFIEGFANKATVDRGSEIIKTDAWELENFKRNPIILFNHGMDTLGGTPVGKATDIQATKDGLFLKVKMSNSQAPGIKMVRDLVEERILKAFSVGFNPKQTDTIQIDGKDVKQISKAELFEVSIVGVPMNQDSLFEITGKSLTTKSFHQLKGEILEARGAKGALVIEEMLGACASRRDAMALVAKTQKMPMTELLDMLAGDGDVPEFVVKAFEVAIKAVDLQQTLEEALASIVDGADEATVLADLLPKLTAASQEPPNAETPAPQEGNNAQAEASKDGESKVPAEGEKGDTITDPANAAASDQAKADAEKDVQQKADFQKCVNDKVPGLLAEGMGQDEAVAVAISQCQVSGKCQLTPASKSSVYAAYFNVTDKYDVFEHKQVNDLMEIVFVKAPGDAPPPADAAPADVPVVEDPVMDSATEQEFMPIYVEIINKITEKMDADASLQIEDATKLALAEIVTDPADKAEVEALIAQVQKDGFENAGEIDAFTKSLVDAALAEFPPEAPAAPAPAPAGKGGIGSGIRGHNTPTKPGKGGRKRKARVPTKPSTPNNIFTRDSARSMQVAKVLGGGALLFGGIALGAAIKRHPNARVAAETAAYIGALSVGYVLRSQIGAAIGGKSQKTVDQTVQENQAPTTAIQTSPSEDSFGSPYLDGQKQTNVLLGALINEIQKLSNQMASLSQQNSVSSTEVPAPKGQAESSDMANNKSVAEDHAKKRLDSLNERLKNLGY